MSKLKEKLMLSEKGYSDSINFSFSLLIDQIGRAHV